MINGRAPLEWSKADAIVLCVEQMVFLTGMNDVDKGTLALQERYGTPLIIVTYDDGCCCYRYGASLHRMPGGGNAGAGEAFTEALLKKLRERRGPVSGMLDSDIQLMLASAAM